VKRASNDTLAGRRYLHLQREAKRTGRPTDELIQLYALECFLDRLAFVSQDAGIIDIRKILRSLKFYADQDRRDSPNRPAGGEGRFGTASLSL
jgi:hypothetical protein